MRRFNEDLKPIAQKLFDQIVTKVTKQARASVVVNQRGGSDCALRGDGGLCCAAGALIKDEFFNPQYNFAGVISPSVLGMIAESQGLSVELLQNNWFPNFIKDCQWVHDDASELAEQEFVEHVTKSFTGVAKHYDLTMPVLA